MPKKWTIRYKEVDEPINEHVTKFGGQPVWVDDIQWPISRRGGFPMRFLCQIRLENYMFPSVKARMAYVFMTDDYDNYIDFTWEPDGGENAVILQPGGSSIVETKEIVDGPSLTKSVKIPGEKYLRQKPCEFAVELIEEDDIEFVSIDSLGDISDEEYDEFYDRDTPYQTKIGGSPFFMKDEEFPFEVPTALLMQLDENAAPFTLNFAGGIGMVFLSKDGDCAKMLLQY